MRETHSSPRFFGRFTAVASDHERLRAALRQLGAMCQALDATPSELPAELDPLGLFTELFADLSRHFAAEEAQAYFGAIAVERPALAPRLARLTAEHATMLETISELRSVAGDRSRAGELAGPGRSLIERLRAHEDKENELLQDFLQMDDGAASD